MYVQYAILMVIMLIKTQTFVRFDNAAFKAELDTPDDSDDALWEGDEIAESQAEDSSQPVGLSSPGKRKYHESDDEDQNSYQQGVNVSEKERQGSRDSGFEGGIMEDVVSGDSEKEHEIVVGVDPSLIMKDGDGEMGQEMQDRGGMPMLAARKMSVQMGTVDSMDLDQVVEDENVAVESTAVNRVKFAE